MQYLKLFLAINITQTWYVEINYGRGHDFHFSWQQALVSVCKSFQSVNINALKWK